MRAIYFVLTLSLILAFTCQVYADDKDNEDSGGGNQMLTGTLLGGLLGGGLGTAIGSISGNAGKGALIGAGVGAVGGALLGANQPAKSSQKKENLAEPEQGKTVTEDSQASSDMKVKKRVIKRYDKEGKLISLYLDQESMHGYQLITKIRKGFGVYLGPSTVYPLLGLLEKKGYVTSAWNMGTERPRKMYKLTNEGKNVLNCYRTRG